MQRIKKTIEEVLNAGLCNGCGTCVGLCPNSAIYMSKSKEGYIPKLNRTECNQCGICFDVCPGHSVNFRKLNSIIFGKEKQDVLMGNYINCYVGHATDLNIRHNSTSGGIITSLLIFAIEEGIIDGALVTKMNDARPLEPEVFIARTKDEIISASKSKYCPVPANTVLKNILRENGRFAIVGLPCHIQGIRKAEMVNKKLAKKIVLHLGLVCNHTPTFSATAYLLQKMKLRKEEVKKIDYRGEGWPGGMSIILANGKKNFVDQFDPFYWGYVFNSYFFPTRCILCNDKMCELSDISFGDAWHLSNSKIGESIIVSRREIGEELLEKATMKKEIEIKKVSSKQIVESQGLDLVKRRHKARILIFKKLGKRVPVCNQEVLESKTSDYVKALSLYLRNYVSSKPYLWNLINIYPSLLTYIKGIHKNYLGPQQLLHKVRN
jgi:coenzyme F420 hydrogenase subunit beta